RERFRQRRRLPSSLISVLLLLLHRSLTLSWLLGEGSQSGVDLLLLVPYRGRGSESHRSLVLMESFGCGGGLCFALRCHGVNGV
ncbi:hypothetical protein IGI04_029034, partial [Brassica rapa subsp. trilocularis]